MSADGYGERPVIDEGMEGLHLVAEARYTAKRIMGGDIQVVGSGHQFEVWPGLPDIVNFGEYLTEILESIANDLEMAERLLGGPRGGMNVEAVNYWPVDDVDDALRRAQALVTELRRVKAERRRQKKEEAR